MISSSPLAKLTSTEAVPTFSRALVAANHEAVFASTTSQPAVTNAPL